MQPLAILNRRLIVRRSLTRLLDWLILIECFVVPWRLPVRANWLPQFLNGKSFSFILILLTIGIWLLLGLPGLRATLRDSRRWWLLSVAAVVGWLGLSVRWSIAPSVSSPVVIGLILAALFALIVTCTGPSLRRVIFALAAGLLLQGVIAIGQTTVQHRLGLDILGETSLAPGDSDLSTLVLGSEQWMRPYGLSPHPNILGGYMAVALLAMTGVLRSNMARRWQIAWLAIAIIGLWALGLTFSRSAWIGFAGGLLVIGIISLRGIYRQRISHDPTAPFNAHRVTLTLLILLLTIGMFIVTYWRFISVRVDVSDTSASLEQRSISDRRYYIGIALQAFAERPVMGLGIGGFLTYAYRTIKAGPYADWMIGDYVHNVPLLILAELGGLGFGLWLLMWAIGLIQAIRTLPDQFAPGLIAGVVALLVIGLFDHYPWTNMQSALLAWAMIGMVLRPKVHDPGY